MNRAVLLLQSPVLAILVKWTALLTLGWMVHWVAFHRHARFRLILWRSMLCFGLVLPLTIFFPLPTLKIPVQALASESTESPHLLAPGAGSGQTPSATALAPALPRPTENGSVSRSDLPIQPRIIRQPIPWNLILLGVWGAGCLYSSSRLFSLLAQLSGLRKAASVASASLLQMAREIQNRLGVRKPVEIRVSDRVRSPFVCGLWRPTLLLPAGMVEDLPPGEISALLSHEMAHLRHHDLAWCLGWRWMAAIYWFHPLVWRAPAAHSLACEQEADRIASGRVEDRGLYARALAQLALRVLSLPAVETKLTLSGASQIARRLQHLKRGGVGAWNWGYSLAGFGLAGILFLATAGAEFSKADVKEGGALAATEFKEVLVTVQDEGGKPIEGATILPDGFRVKGRHSADAYHWGSEMFGGPVKAVTDSQGKAHVRYPVMGIPEEKEFTGALIFSVSHPEFSTVRLQEYAVDGAEGPIHLARGISLEVSGYFGEDHQAVTELVPNLSQEGVHPEDWDRLGNGTLILRRLSPGGHMLQLMGRLPSNEIVYSDYFAFSAETGKPCRLALEMRPGIRLEGRLDDNVARPVKNGRVMVSVRPKEYPALLVIEDFYDLDKQYGGRYFWHSYRPIQEDGTFVFESIPPGEVDVVVLGEGFASQSKGRLQNRASGNLQPGAIMAVPQPFPLLATVTKIEVTTEPTATLEFRAKTKSGDPIEGVWVGMFSSAFRMRGNFGWVKRSSEEPYREIPHLADLDFAGKTGPNGALVIQNIPGRTRGLSVDHPQFQVPLQDPEGWRDRHVREVFSPGVTNKVTLTLEPKGTDFIGTSR